MNKIINKCLLTTDKFIPELHFRQPALTYSACGPFTKHRETILKFRETGNFRHSYRNELGKACFVHGATYSDWEDLAKRTILTKVWKIELMKLLKILDMMNVREN